MSSANNNDQGEVAAPHQRDGIADLLAIVEETPDMLMEDAADTTTIEPTEDNTLRDGVMEEMRKLLTKATPSLRNGVSMRFTLLLLVQEFRDLAEGANFSKDFWLGELRATIRDAEEDDTIRYWVGRTVTDALAQAPWGLEKSPNTSSCDTAQTVNSIFAAMCRFVRQLNAELSSKGVNLDDFDDGEDEEDENEDNEDKQPAATAPKAKKSRKNPNARDARGNHGHGPARPWTDEEYLSLLKTWRDNGDKQHKEKVSIHNATYRPAGDDRVRTREGLRQQMDKLVGLTPRGLNGRIDVKIAELENSIAAKTT